MPNKLTDAEIKKALAQCENQTYCSDCPYYTKIGCKKHLYQDALVLINRQAVRIHQQEKTIMEIQNANLIDFKATIGNYIAENESLKAEVEKQKDNYMELLEISSTRADTISKQSVEIERLKTEIAVIMKQALAENKTTATAIMAETKQHIMTAEKIKRLEEEIERLKTENKHYAELEQGCYVTGVKNIKAEAYKECIEKAKERLSTCVTDTQQMMFELRLDNLLNELVGDTNGN